MHDSAANDACVDVENSARKMKSQFEVYLVLNSNFSMFPLILVLYDFAGTSQF